MNKLVSFCFALFFLKVCLTQSYAEKYAYYIDTNNLKETLTVLSHDSLKGRMTGTLGQQKAALFIKNYFKEHALQPLFGNSYSQKFSVKKTTPSGHLIFNSDTLKFFNDYLFFNEETSAKIETSEVVYVAKDLENINKNEVNNKFVLLTNKEIIDYDSHRLESYFEKLFTFEAKGIIYATATMNEIKRDFKSELKGPIYSLLENVSDELDFPLFFVDEKILEHLKFESLFQKWRFKRGKNVEIAKVGKLHGEMNPKQEKIVSENLGAFLPANNDSEESVVLMAHYDHIGAFDGEIFNGADDNASGVSVILELSRLLRIAKKEYDLFDKNILFLLVSAEEIGLLGSEHYVENASFPIRKTTAVLNIDMVGRENKDGEDYSLYVIGGDRVNDSLGNFNRFINDTYVGLDFDYTYNEKDHEMNLFYRSDHYNFAKNGVPSIFYFGGFHEDYHKPTDTVEKINFNKLKEVVKLMLFMVIEI